MKKYVCLGLMLVFQNRIIMEMRKRDRPLKFETEFIILLFHVQSHERSDTIIS